MLFEFDPAKSEANERKHGIDFEAAKALWDDPYLLLAPARSTDEPRILAIGRIAGRCWSAIITHRGEAIRLKSVRRARAEEIERYESE